jgi:hypothetical protein
VVELVRELASHFEGYGWVSDRASFDDRALDALTTSTHAVVAMLDRPGPGWARTRPLGSWMRRPRPCAAKLVGRDA